MKKYINLRNKLVNQLMSIPYNTKIETEIKKMRKLIECIENANKKIVEHIDNTKYKTLSF